MPKDFHTPSDDGNINSYSSKKFSPHVTLQSRYKEQKVELLQIESALDVHENPFYTVGIHVFKPKCTPLRVSFHFVEGKLSIYRVSYGTTEDREEGPKNIIMKDIYHVTKEIYDQHILVASQENSVEKKVKEGVRKTLFGPKLGENILSAQDIQKKLREISSGLDFDGEKSFFERAKNEGELYFRSVPFEGDGKIRPIRTKKTVKVVVLGNKYSFFIQTPIATGWEEIKYEQFFPETSAKRIYAATKNLLQAKKEHYFVSDAGFFQEPLGTGGFPLVSHTPPSQLTFDLVPLTSLVPLKVSPEIGRDTHVGENVKSIIERVSAYKTIPEYQYFDDDAIVNNAEGYVVLGFKTPGGCNYAVKTHFMVDKHAQRTRYILEKTEFFKIVNDKVESVSEENFKLKQRDNRDQLKPNQFSQIENHISQMLQVRLGKKEMLA